MEQLPWVSESTTQGGRSKPRASAESYLSSSSRRRTVHQVPVAAGTKYENLATRVQQPPVKCEATGTCRFPLLLQLQDSTVPGFKRLTAIGMRDAVALYPGFGCTSLHMNKNCKAKHLVALASWHQRGSFHYES